MFSPHVDNFGAAAWAPNALCGWSAGGAPTAATVQMLLLFTCTHAMLSRPHHTNTTIVIRINLLITLTSSFLFFALLLCILFDLFVSGTATLILCKCKLSGWAYFQRPNVHRMFSMHRYTYTYLYLSQSKSSRSAVVQQERTTVASFRWVSLKAYVSYYSYDLKYIDDWWHIPESTLKCNNAVFSLHVCFVKTQLATIGQKSNKNLWNGYKLVKPLLAFYFCPCRTWSNKQWATYQSVEYNSITHAFDSMCNTPLTTRLTRFRKNFAQCFRKEEICW